MQKIVVARTISEAVQQAKLYQARGKVNLKLEKNSRGVNVEATVLNAPTPAAALAAMRLLIEEGKQIAEDMR